MLAFAVPSRGYPRRNLRLPPAATCVQGGLVPHRSRELQHFGTIVSTAFHEEVDKLIQAQHSNRVRVDMAIQDVLDLSGFDKTFDSKCCGSNSE